MELNSLENLSQEDAELLIQTLEPIANAFKRTQHFQAPPDTAYVVATVTHYVEFELYADPGEFVDKDPCELLKLRHFGRISNLYDILVAAHKKED